MPIPKNPTASARQAPAARKRPKSSGELRRVSASLRKFALSLPEATEDFPWGERVAKAKGRVFVFLGTDPVAGSGMGLSVKLPASKEDALDLPFAKPTGYGLGKSGWITATFGPHDRPPVEILKDWILESYRAVAPRKLADEVRKSGG